MVHRPECNGKVFLRFSGGSSTFFFVPGLEKLEVHLRNRLPPNIIPDTPVERELSINGESDRLCPNCIPVYHRAPFGWRPRGEEKVRIQEATSWWLVLKRTLSMRGDLVHPRTLSPPCGLSAPASALCCSLAGELIGSYTAATLKPDGVRQLINLPLGSAEAEVGALLTQVQVYNYLESTSSWGVLRQKVQEDSAKLRQRIQDGEEG